LAVVKTLDSFMLVPSLPTDWISTPFVSLLFQNLICEERTDIRDASLSAWKTALSVIAPSPGRMENVVTQQLILDWYAIVMTPIGIAIDTSAFHNPSIAVEGALPLERHNVDKNMLAQDLSLITVDVTFKARIATAKALASLMIHWPAEVNLLHLTF
jgi:TATA-binding protein-associated factor